MKPGDKVTVPDPDRVYTVDMVDSTGLLKISAWVHPVHVVPIGKDRNGSM